jgi:hypothetical protein
MATEVRCEHKMHGVLHEGILEVKCRSSLCGHRSGVVVIHRFSAATGLLVETKYYKDTPIIKKEQ